jgi:hypothetical protein
LRPRAIFIARLPRQHHLVNVVRIAAKRPVDASRVEVAAWINRTGDPSLDRIGVNAAERLIAAIRKTGVIKDARLAGAPSSVRAAMVVAGDFTRVGNTLQFHVSITDMRRAGKPWSLALITARVGAPEQAIDSARPRVIGAIAALQHPIHAALFPLATSPPTYEAYQEFLEGMTLQSQERIIDAREVSRRCRDRQHLHVVVGPRGDDEPLLVSCGRTSPHGSAADIVAARARSTDASSKLTS